VKDYTCMLIKQERIKGRLDPENIISMQFRSQPFSVYMKWLSPANWAGQEVCYVHGKNRNQMRVKSKEVGVLGTISIDPTDRKVMEHSRHTIYEAGIGNMIETFVKAWETERQLNKTQVRVDEYTYDKRLCYRIETTRTERLPQFYCYRSVLYL